MDILIHDRVTNEPDCAQASLTWIGPVNATRSCRSATGFPLLPADCSRSECDALLNNCPQSKLKDNDERSVLVDTHDTLLSR